MNERAVPLTLTQQDIYFDQLSRKGSPLYNVGGYIELGRIDVERLARAHAQVVASHDVFGLRIVREAAAIFQTLSKTRTTCLARRDFSRSAAPEADAKSWLEGLFAIPLQMERAELFRAHLLQIAADRYWYAVVAHHIALDGWGFSNLAHELCELYNGDGQDRIASPSWLSVAREDQEYLGSEKYQRDRQFWLDQMGALPDSLLSPRDTQTGPAGPARSSRKVLQLAPTEFGRFESVARSLAVSVPHVFLAALACYFGAASGRDAVVFGIPFHNRRNSRDKDLLGVFMSVSPVQIALAAGDATVEEVIRAVARVQRACLRHQRYPAGHLVRDLGLSGVQGRMYDVRFNYLLLDSRLSFGGCPGKLTYLSHHHEVQPLTVTVWEGRRGEPVELQFDYNHEYFTEHDADRLLQRIRLLLGIFPNSLHERVANLQVLPETEIKLLLGDGSLPTEAGGAGTCIHSLFEAQVARTPRAVAVVFGQQHFTYQELDARANEVARHLIRRGVEPEVLVGICMERSAEMLVAVLGILKAGGAYLPLDPSYPPTRIAAIVEDSGVSLVIVDELSISAVRDSGARPVLLHELRGRVLDDNHDVISNSRRPTGDSLAYIIYTSGSTGRPKGVAICHRNTVALLKWAAETYSAQELSAVLASTSLSFDLSVFEIFAPLTLGHRCVLVRNALALLEASVEVTLINTVPSAMQVLIEKEAVPAGVRVVNLAGEALPRQLVNRLLERGLCARVFNLYGPSECTTYSTFAEFRAPLAQFPAIGRAVRGTRLYVLTESGRLAPYGSIGELYIAGQGVARGYWRNPQLTASCFVENPFSATRGDRLYRTGDWVRYRDDGSLEFLGRHDNQVKIRGYRIELDEIERQLERLDGVQSAAVLMKRSSSGDSRLVAFVRRAGISGDPEGHASDLHWAANARARLEASLPRYMVPAVMHTLREFPLTANGKIDRKRLAELESPVPGEIPVPPATRTESTLVGLCGQVLEVGPERISVEAGFLDLGGDSLMLVRLADRICAHWGIELALETLFERLSLRTLAAKIDAELALQFMRKRLGTSKVVHEGRL
jgi:amino acid adenylation domain-containing protein